MRFSLIILLLIFSLHTVATEPYEISYCLSGKVFDKSLKPVCNAEIRMISGKYCRYFKTDNKGNYKVEVYIFLIRGRGYPPLNDSEFIRQMSYYNEPLLTFVYDSTSVSIPSKWQKYCLGKSYHFGSIQNAEHANIYLTENVKHEKHTVVEDYRKKLNSYCNISQKCIDGLIAYEAWRINNHFETKENYLDTIAGMNSGYYDSLARIFHDNVRIDFLQLLMFKDLHNRHIDSIADNQNLGICSSLIRLKKIDNNTYLIYHSFTNDIYAEIINLNNKGYILEYFTKYLPE